MPRTSLFPLLAGCALASSTAFALDFVRQIQSINGAAVVVDMPVNDSAGEVISSNLEADLSIFQLWAAYTKADRTTEMLKLDEKSVGTFLPTVSIVATSEDPFVPTCTRADRPYGVTVTVSGMLAGDMYPEYTKSVAIKRGYKVYSPVFYVPTGETGDYADSQVFRGNGTFSDPVVYQMLPGGSPTQAVGAEVFSASVLPEAPLSLGQLASAEVIVWPVGTASINGIEAGATYKLGLPSAATITLRNAYPRSTTYAQIYPGPQRLGTAGRVLTNTVVSYGTGPNAPTIPQSTTIPLVDPSNRLQNLDGQYTMEILTVTPFKDGAPERLAYVTFMIDGSIELRSNMNTME